jgi:hypothetical protein
VQTDLGNERYLEKLHLLVFAENKLGGFAPVWGMFPPMLDEARRVAVYLHQHR